MKMLFYAPQMAAYGGMERHICLLAAAAARKGHQVRLLTTSRSLGKELREELQVPGIHFSECNLSREEALRPGRLTSLKKLSWLLFQGLRNRSYKPDLIYTNGQSGLAKWVWREAGPATRIIHHHHTAADKLEQATWAPSFIDVLKKAPEIVGCSRATCTHISEAIQRRKDITYLPYITRCSIRSDEVKEPEPRVGRPLRFGFIGRLVKEKGVDRLLELARVPELKGIEWHIHGSGDAYPPSRFEGLERVVYHGAFRSAAEHKAILEQLDAVLLLSTHNEGMPLSLMESMSAGLPWLATDKGGTREMALSYYDSLVVPPDLDLGELAGACLELQSRIQTAKTSRRRQREIYDRGFSPEVAVRSWLDFFECAPPRGNP